MQDEDNKKADRDAFIKAMRGVKPLKHQNTALPFLHQPRTKNTQIQDRKEHHNIQNTLYFFSDDYKPLPPSEASRQYLKPDHPKHLLKRLRRGDFQPELFADLHGLTQREAKQELAAIINACIQEKVTCASIIHGHGKHILKEKVPQWLAQHPNIIAFHSPPSSHGGHAALWVLIHTNLDD